MRSRLWLFPAILLFLGLAAILVLTHLPAGASSSDEAAPPAGAATVHAS